MMAGLTRICPICGERLKGIVTDWVLKDWKTENDHQVCTIGTAWNASDSIRQAAQFQIASNLAAYTLDYDIELNLGWYGTAWIQCPQARETVTGVTFPR
jgi:hypothetical protein